MTKYKVRGAKNVFWQLGPCEILIRHLRFQKSIPRFCSRLGTNADFFVNRSRTGRRYCFIFSQKIKGFCYFIERKLSISLNLSFDVQLKHQYQRISLINVWMKTNSHENLLLLTTEFVRPPTIYVVRGNAMFSYRCLSFFSRLGRGCGDPTPWPGR